MASEQLSPFHIPALDGIRGLAILLVVPHNANLMLGLAYHGPGYFAKEYSLVGWVGVQLFFVLSGFLITGGLLDSRNSENYFSTFYARRALRIFPLYYGMLILCFLILAPLHLLPQETLATRHNEIWLWTFLSNWTDPLGYEVRGFSHFWSLAVEEQFYLLWPLLIYRLRPTRVLGLCVAICVVALGIRIGMRFADSPPESLYEFTVCRMDALAFGAAAAAYLRVPSARASLERHLDRALIIAALVLACGALLTHMYQRTGLETQTFGFSTLAMGFALLILVASQPQPESGAHAWVSRILSWAPLRSAGKYSYAMYVFHYPLHQLVGKHLLGHEAVAPRAAIAVLYACSLTLAAYLLAVVSYRYYEAPFLRLKRFFPVRSPEAVPAYRGLTRDGT